MKAPYEFTGPYAGCYTTPALSLDKRHVFVLYELLRSGLFIRALEVGCANGASSTAFVEAVNRNSQLNVTFCDPVTSQMFLNALNNVDDIDRVQLVQAESQFVLSDAERFGGPFDFILLDGDHSEPVVTEEIALIDRSRLLGIAGHDTSATCAGYRKAEGAELLKRTAMFDWGWYCIEDNMIREGEETQRGLFFATPSLSVYKRALATFKRHCFTSKGELSHVG